MATITPDVDVEFNIPVISWTGAATGDTISGYAPSILAAAIGSVQVTGTFGGATVTLTGSNDGTNFVTMKDATGADISLTAAGAAEFSTAMLYIKPGISGGTGDDVNVTVVLRG